MIRITRYRYGEASGKLTDKEMGRRETGLSSWGAQHYDGIDGRCATFAVTVKDNDTENITLHVTITEDELIRAVNGLKEFEEERT